MLGYEALMQCYPLTLDDLPDEVWLPIPDWQDYQVSNFGRVKSFKLDKQRILKPQLSKHGYLRIELNERGKVKKFFVHRLVAICFVPNPENKPYINHRDGYKLNCHVSNLEWATASENVRHAYDNGLITLPEGQDSGRAKLTNEQVQYIRVNPEGLSSRRLAKQFNVSQAQISAIQLGRYYKQAGGSVRAKKKGGRQPILDNIRNQIRAEYIFGSCEFSLRALARKYGISQPTVWRILHEG